MKIKKRPKKTDTLREGMQIIADAGKCASVGKPLIIRKSELWDIEKDGITQSMLSTFMTCKRKMYLSYIKGLKKSSRSEAMDFGNVFHDLLDSIYSKSMEEDKQTFVEGIDRTIKAACRDYYDLKHEELNQLSDLDLPTLEKNVGICETLVPQYFDFYRDDWFKIDWVALEEVFDVPLEVGGTTIRIRGKFDGVMRIKGKLWLFETKTKGIINEDIISDKLSIDLQVHLYCWAIWKKYGEFPVGVIYNIVKRPMLRQGKKETLVEFISRCKADIFDNPDKYFVREHGALDKSELLEWVDTEFMPLMLDVLQWARGGLDYKNVSACTNGFGPCTFLQYCAQNNNGLYTQKKRLFEELTVIPLKDAVYSRLDKPGK